MQSPWRILATGALAIGGALTGGALILAGALSVRPLPPVHTMPSLDPGPWCPCQTAPLCDNPAWAKPDDCYPALQTT